MRKHHIGWTHPAAGAALVLALGASAIGSTLTWAEEPSRSEDREYVLDDSRGREATGEHLSVAEIAARLEERGLGEIREIEREGLVYEVELRGPDGGRTELELDAQTGEVLRRETDH